MKANKNIYFLSDFHLGSPDFNSSKKREKKIILFLEEIKDKAEEIYLMGDIFDFWFEYKKVIPKGFVRFLGKLAEISDSGIKIFFFPGNHDMWVKEYLNKEIGLIICKNNTIKKINNKLFFLGHGDGINKKEKTYIFLKKIFKNKICQKIFYCIHPDLGISIAEFFSQKSRKKNKTKNSNDKDLIEYCKKIKKNTKIDYFIFGHKHYPKEETIDKESIYINLGDWVKNYSYVVFNGEKLEIKKY